MSSDSRTMETIYWQSRQSFPDNKKSNKRKKPVRPNRPILDQFSTISTTLENRVSSENFPQSCPGTGDATKTDESLEKFQTAFDLDGFPASLACRSASGLGTSTNPIHIIMQICMGYVFFWICEILKKEI